MTGPHETETPEVNAKNEFVVLTGTNLPNHSFSVNGLANFVRVSGVDNPACRTKQSLYRLVAWLLVYADTLPDEPGEHTLEEIQNAVEEVAQR